MMKNKRVIVAAGVMGIVMALLAVFVGIGVTAEVEMKTWSDVIEESIESETDDIMDVYDERMNVELNNLTVYEFRSFYYDHGRRSHADLALSSILPNLTVFNRVYPIEHVEKIDSDNLYVVYKLKDEELGTVFAYVRFEREIETKEDGSIVNWDKTGELYFVSGEFTSADFADVKIGDSVESVCAIDPAVAFDKKEVTIVPEDEEHELVVIENNVIGGCLGFSSYRLLKDGLLIIEFKSPRQSDPVYTVSNITFCPYGEELPENLPKYVTVNQRPRSLSQLSESAK